MTWSWSWSFQRHTKRVGVRYCDDGVCRLSAKPSHGPCMIHPIFRREYCHAEELDYGEEDDYPAEQASTKRVRAAFDCHVVIADFSSARRQ